MDRVTETKTGIRLEGVTAAVNGMADKVLDGMMMDPGAGVMH